MCAEIGSSSPILACLVLNAAIHHRQTCEKAAHIMVHEVIRESSQFCAEEHSVVNVIGTQQRHLLKIPPTDAWRFYWETVAET